jgi:predicted dehydrogenase
MFARAGHRPARALPPHVKMVRLRVGLVGAGIAAQAIHVPVLQRRPDLFRVTAVCDPSATARNAVADRCSVGDRSRHESVEEMIEAGRLDALLVLSSGSHGAICILASKAGLPVFCEKPLAYTIAEADALARAPALLALGYMKVYDDAVRRAAVLLEGRTPRSVEVVVVPPTQDAQLSHLRIVRADDVSPDQCAEWEEGEQRLLDDALGDAPRDARDLYRRQLLGSIVHDLAVVRALVGDPVAWDRIDVWRSSVVLDGHLAGGGRLSIRWHYLEGYPAYREEVRVHDEQGTVAIVFPSPYLPSPAATLEVVDQDRRWTATSTASPFETELEAFHRLVTSAEPTAAGVVEGRADIVTCQRAARLYCSSNGLAVGGEAVSRAS